MNNKFYERLGTRPDALPLRPSGHIVCGNACRLDWNTVCPHTADEEVYVMGNPPYLGSRNQEKTHKEDMHIVWGNVGKSLDYITSWLLIGAKYIQGNENMKCAFVSTNSICQGEQVALLWEPIFNLGIEIGFAHKSFKWNNNAKHNAAVICIVVGLRNICSKHAIIFSETHSEAVPKISPYLTRGTTSFITRRSKPICSFFPDMRFGNMPNDNGHLLLTEEEMETLVDSYPQVSKYIKKFVGAQGFINGTHRYCFLFPDSAVDEINNIIEIKTRLDKVVEHRKNSTERSTQMMAEYPHRFYFCCHQDTDSIIVPATSSERRRYIPIGFLNKDTVISNSAFAIYDASLWLMGILTSYMHNLWMKSVGGKLKTDYRYSTALCYNTFPFPKINEEQKERLSALAENILLTRENHTEMTLGEMYNPESMPQDLKYAHQAMDIAVEQCYRPEPFTSDEERLEYLFKLYEKMTKKK